MIRLVAVLAVVLGLVGCAHAQKPESTEVSTAPAPAPRQAEPAPAPAPAPDPAAELATAVRGTTVFFDFDSDQLKPEGEAALQRVGEVLRRYPALQIKVEGNCDERGTEEYNLVLGEKRAAAARKYLLTLGASAGQVDTISYGALRPANAAHTEQAWSQNRRDELTVASK